MERLRDNDIEFGRLSFSLKRIVGQTLPRIRNWTEEQKLIICENIVNYCSSNKIDISEELRAIENERFKFELGHDETFCHDVGIPYHNFDKHIEDLRAAVALWYYDRYCVH